MIPLVKQDLFYTVSHQQEKNLLQAQSAHTFAQINHNQTIVSMTHCCSLQTLRCRILLSKYLSRFTKILYQQKRDSINFITFAQANVYHFILFYPTLFLQTSLPELFPSMIKNHESILISLLLELAIFSKMFFSLFLIFLACVDFHE